MDFGRAVLRLFQGKPNTNPKDGPKISPLLLENDHSQEQSPLFQLPGEIRQTIYTYALTTYEDASHPYNPNTYWFRPQYLAARKCDTALLRACKRIYKEGWFIPFSSADHTFWLTGAARAPGKTMTRQRFANALKAVYACHGLVEIQQVRFFAQLYMLEPGNALSEFLCLEHFHPKCVTITLRHTDWWYWEHDRILCINSIWVRDCRFPASVRQVKMELESLERKKNQIDSIVTQMKSNWYFVRTDGEFLSAKDTPVEISRWKGSSTWSSSRWIRDETETEPEILNYYVATVTWQRESQAAIDETHQPTDITSTVFDAIDSTFYESHIYVYEMEEAGIPPGTDCKTAWRLLEEHRNAATTELLNVDGELA